MRLLAIVLLLVVLVLALPGKLHPAIIRVPDDQPTIAAALAAATAGDEVVLACGTYYENRLNVKPGIILRSELGTADCAVIDGSGHQLLRLNPASDTVLEGLTLRRGYGGALVVNSLNVVIRRCAFLENSRFRRDEGGGLLLDTSDVSVSECRFEGNRARRGNAIRDWGGTLEITNSEFLFNASPEGYGFAAVQVTDAGSITIRSSLFTGNDWTLDVQGGTCTIEDSRFEANGGGFSRSGDSPVLFFNNSAVFIRRSTFLGNNGERHFFGSPAYYFTRCPSVTIESCVFHGDRSYDWALFRTWATRVEFRRSIVADVLAAQVFGCGVAVSCSDVWDYSGALFAPGCADTSGVIIADPLFCNPDAGDYRISSLSPCRPEASPCGELIGAFGVGCGPVSAEVSSWGKIKNLYR